MSVKERALDVAETVWRALPSRVRGAYLRTTQPRYMVGVVGLIYDDEGQILLLRHRFRVPYPWGLCGGFIEHDETPEQALAREVREETGLLVEIDPEIVDTHLNVKGRFLTMTLKGRAKSTHLRLSGELREGGFTDPDTLPAGTEPRQAALIRRYGRLPIAEGDRAE